MYKCVLTFEVIISISLGYLNDMQPHIMNDLEIWLCLPQADILYVSFELHQANIPASSIWPM